MGRGGRIARRNVDVLRSKIQITSTAVEVRGHVTLGREPKDSTIPVNYAGCQVGHAAARGTSRGVRRA